MKRAFLISTAAAVLTLGMAAANAQQAQDARDHGAPARTQQPQQYPSASPRAERNEAPRAHSQNAPRPEANERGNLNARSTTGSAPRDENASREQQPNARPPAANTTAAPRGENRNVQREDQRQNASTQRQQQPSQAGRSDRFERNANERLNSRNASERFNNRNPQQQQMRSQERTTTGSTPSGERNARTATDRTGGRAAQPESRAARGAVNMTTEQRTRVTERFAARIDSMGVRPISRSRISVRVGASIPGSIQLYDVPADVVAIYPQFRRDRFVLVEDEIVVVEPGSRRIVAVLPRGGRTAVRESTRETTGSATSSDRLRLSAEDRREIRTIVLRDPECRYEARLDFSLLIPLPRSVRVCEFPQTVVSEVPEIERYRFVVRGDDIVVVDPDEYRVVDVIR